jgi:hypothetical protein
MWTLTAGLQVSKSNKVSQSIIVWSIFAVSLVPGLWLLILGGFKGLFLPALFLGAGGMTWLSPLAGGILMMVIGGWFSVVLLIGDADLTRDILPVTVLLTIGGAVNIARVIFVRSRRTRDEKGNIP